MATSRDNPDAQPLIAVAVLNWRAHDQTVACLDALRSLDYRNFTVVLVDNGCADFDGQAFAPEPAISYVRSDVNLGFAGGCNLALQRATELGADYLWFLNNDALPEPESLRTLVEASIRSQAAILGPKILRDATESPRLDSMAVAIDRSSGRFALIGHDEVDIGQYDGLEQVEAVTGCAMLVRADVARRLAGFDERYYLYLEDLDLCLRALAIGERVVTVPGARVLHQREASRQGRQSQDSLYYTCRNHFLLMATHGRGGALRSAARNATILALNLAFALFGGSAQAVARVGAVIAGARDYGARRFGPRISRPST